MAVDNSKAGDKNKMTRAGVPNAPYRSLFFVLTMGISSLIDVLCRLVKYQEVDHHFDSEVITVYGDQGGAEKRYNPQKNGRKSYYMKICTIEPFGFILGMRLEPGNAVSNADLGPFYQDCVDAMPQNHQVVRTVRQDSGFISEENNESFEGDCLFFEVGRRSTRTSCIG